MPAKICPDVPGCAQLNSKAGGLSDGKHERLASPYDTESDWVKQEIATPVGAVMGLVMRVLIGVPD